MEEKEIWKDIAGYEGLYQISNMGNVKSLNYHRTGKERIMKGRKDKNGYLLAHLSKDGKAKNYQIHRLVAIAFIPNPDNLPVINHKNEIKSDNRVSNLEWCSYSYNNSYNDKGKKIGEKLSKPVLAIHKINGLILEFSSIMEAERETGINNGGITQCCQGKRNSAGDFYWMYKNNTDDAE